MAKRYSFYEGEIVRAFFVPGMRELRMKKHDFWEIGYVYEGGGTLHSGGSAENINPGEFVIIQPDTEYDITSPPKNEGALLWMCSCIFKREYAESIFNAYTDIAGGDYVLYKRLIGEKNICIHLRDNNVSNIRGLLWVIANEYAHFTTGSETVIHHSLTDLLVCASRIYENNGNKNALQIGGGDIKELVRYLQTHFSYHITLEHLAERMHISREYLARSFKQRTGKTIFETLTEIRLKTAMDMLRSPQKHPIGDIAEYCGYSSIGNFQKAFKKMTGISPREYRNRYGNFK